MHTPARSLVVSALVLQLAVAPPVMAENCYPGAWGPLDPDPKLVQPMAFSIHGESVYAEGQITDGTAARFRTFLASNPLPEGTWIWLMSGGGNLDEGLELGKLIRERKFNTGVTRECFSSCTFTFLGGVKRSMLSWDMYGVHQFSFRSAPNADTAASDAQKVSVTLYNYVRSMGVDTRLIDEMVKADQTQVNSLSVDRLRALKVVNAPPNMVDPTPNQPTCQ